MYAAALTEGEIEQLKWLPSYLNLLGNWLFFYTSLPFIFSDCQPGQNLQAQDLSRCVLLFYIICSQ
jgi:hypothetical protein